MRIFVPIRPSRRTGTDHNIDDDLDDDLDDW